MKKTKKVNRKKQLRTRLLAGIILIMAVIALTCLIPTRRRISQSAYFGLKGSDSFGVAAGDERFEHPGTMINGKRFIDLRDAEDVTSALYYERDEGLLIASAPREKIVLDLSSGDSAEGEACVQNGQVLISLDFLCRIADVEVVTYPDSDRVYIRTEWTRVEQTVESAAPVRVKAGIKGRIITQVQAGDEVTAVDRNPDGTPAEGKKRGWTKVISPDGFAGFIEDRYLGECSVKTLDHVNTVGEYTKTYLSEPVNMIFHQTTDQASNNALTEALEGVSGVNVIAPTWFFLDGEDGSVTSLANSSYVEKAHAAGMKVWAVLNDFDGAVHSGESTGAFLESASARDRLITTVAEALRESGADGLNIDFEKVRESNIEAFIEFLREISVELRKEGMTLSVDNYVPLHTKYMKRSVQAEIAEYIVVMCYDEHTSGSKTAGSAASLPFVKKGIQDTLKEVPADQVIEAVPFFTRVWITDSSGKLTSKALGMGRAEAYIEEHGMTVSWDDKTGQYYAETDEDGSKIRIWLEDAASIEEKLKVMKEYDCAGCAQWKLGLEKREIWELISQYLA